MALHTTNIYGNITISDDAVAVLISKVAKDCVGVAELVSRRLSDSVLMIFNKEPISKGIKLVTMDSRIYIDIYILVFDGISVDAVVASLKSAIVYHVEHFTGMRVKAIDVHVVGMKL
ncbi:MAG: Asp23/Gls24 family envelope stress response protein [Clostridiales bacterium]|nr:Asp23/Gls24 family envelope stress response protein [Clostridiales bacterium]